MEFKIGAGVTNLNPHTPARVMAAADFGWGEEAGLEVWSLHVYNAPLRLWSRKSLSDTFSALTVVHLSWHWECCSSLCRLRISVYKSGLCLRLLARETNLSAPLDGLCLIFEVPCLFGLHSWPSWRVLGAQRLPASQALLLNCTLQAPAACVNHSSHFPEMQVCFILIAVRMLPKHWYRLALKSLRARSKSILHSLYEHGSLKPQCILPGTTRESWLIWIPDGAKSSYAGTS